MTKFYPSQLESLTDKIGKGEIRALFCFGPNSGAISRAYFSIEKKLNLFKREISSEELKSDSLEISLNSKNFFGQRELAKIYLKDSPQALYARLKEVLDKNFSSFLFLVGAESESTSSPVRKLFEGRKDTASVGFYFEEGGDLRSGILKLLYGAKKTIGSDALEYLLLKLRGDSYNIENEIGKLLDFVGSSSDISLEDAKSVISDIYEGNFDEAVIYLLENRLPEFFSEIEKLKENGINEVSIVRFFSRYHTNLYLARAALESGADIDTACKKASPPIFFKYLPFFKKILPQTEKADIIKSLGILVAAEKELKISPEIFDFYGSVFSKINR